MAEFVRRGVPGDGRPFLFGEPGIRRPFWPDLAKAMLPLREDRRQRRRAQRPNEREHGLRPAETLVLYGFAVDTPLAPV